MAITSNKPRLAISACLLGQAVRFDGSHKQNRLPLDLGRQYFDLRPVCPEVEMGLGVPRPMIQLRKSNTNEIKLVYSKQPHAELTSSMRDFARGRVPRLGPLDGFIVKKNSPSCGMENVPVLNVQTGQRERIGTGIFTEIFKELYPTVPIEEEGRLNNADIQENFIERVYAHHRWRQSVEPGKGLQAFREFHKKYKYILLSRGTIAYQQLGRLVASTTKHNLSAARQEYFHSFMLAMKKRPTRGQHVNVLTHLLGYLKNKLNANDKAELLKWFESYRNYQVNRITPLALLAHHFRCYPNNYIADQYYFDPLDTVLGTKI